MCSDSSPVLHQGWVTRKNRGQYLVSGNGSSVPCTLSGVLWKQLVYSTADPASSRRRVVAVEEIDVVDPVAVGDHVQFTETGDGTGVITEILPRRNKLIRNEANAKIHHSEQIIATNIDHVIPVFSITKPKPKWKLLDRYLVAAESNDIPSIICLTKVDLVADDYLASEIAIYERAGYAVFRTSALTGKGIDAFREVLQGRVSVMIGKSGVGKTSLLNAVQPDLGLRINAVNEKTGKGKHTTTHLEMFPLADGGGIIDTPGMREFGLRDIEPQEIAACFPEMRPYLGQCQFGLSCQHISEPGCAVKQAMADGIISQQRYQSYCKLSSG